LEYDESNVNVADYIKFKMATWWPYFCRRCDLFAQIYIVDIKSVKKIYHGAFKIYAMNFKIFAATYPITFVILQLL